MRRNYMLHRGWLTSKGRFWFSWFDQDGELQISKGTWPSEELALHVMQGHRLGILVDV